MDRELKIVGSFKKDYKRFINCFQKKHYHREEFLWELRGYKIAEKLHIMTPAIVTFDKGTLTISFELIELPRLDQMVQKKAHFIFDVVDNLAFNLSRLHKETYRKQLPRTELAKSRMIKMQNELISFGSVPKYLGVQIQKIISKELEMISQRNHACFVHGDFTLQNIFVNPSDKALLFFDWENSHYSDPLYDIGIFFSFLGVLAIKFAKFQPDDLLQIEEHFFTNYQQEYRLEYFEPAIVHFYQIFSCHTTYWFYLYLLDQVRQRFNIPLLEKYLSGETCHLEELHSELESRFQLRPKYTSFLKAYNFLCKSPRIKSLPFSRPAELNFIGK